MDEFGKGIREMLRRGHCLFGKFSMLYFETKRSRQR
jgi:hypothetical protein